VPRYLRYFLAGLAILVVCMPIAFIVSILLSPLWSWIEKTYGIESIGHSGPSDWCFYVVYGVLVVLAWSVFAFIRVHLRPIGKTPNC
jgi:phosphotransferase system  glucose/maltose/N-acetylglucosamine-specific IIC component